MSVIPVYFHEDAATQTDSIVLRKGDGKLVSLTRETIGKDIFSDVGIFARFKEPHQRKPIFIISGLTTSGVLGAAKCFADTEDGLRNCKYINYHDEDLSNFCAIFRVFSRKTSAEVVVETPILEDNKILLLRSLATI